MQNKKRLFILGAGGFGREIESWINLTPKHERNWTLHGFLDDNLNALNEHPSDYKVLGTIFSFEFQKNDCVIFGIADPKIKKQIHSKLKNKVEIITFIAPNVIIGKFTTIGTGSVICPNSIISTNTVIGDCTTIVNGTNIGHDCKIDNYSSFMANVDVGGNCCIGSQVFMGTNSTLIPGRTVNDNIFIGTGAIIVSNLKKEGTYFGNPAKKIY